MIYYQETSSTPLLLLACILFSPLQALVEHRFNIFGIIFPVEYEPLLTEKLRGESHLKLQNHCCCGSTAAVVR